MAYKQCKSFVCLCKWVCAYVFFVTCMCSLSCFICGTTWWYMTLHVCLCGWWGFCVYPLSVLCLRVCLYECVISVVQPPQVFVYELGSCGDLSCKHTPVLRASWITLRRTSHSVSHIWTHLVTIHPLSQRSLASINNNESCNQRWNSQREPGVWSFISCIQFVVYNSFSCIR